jgi:3-isopropylmalate/(R)-2-methylmalate dehydratase small subunit
MEIPLMQPLRLHSGLAVPLDRANVDTDQIIPKQFLKRIERSGFGQFLFYDWARHANGDHNPDFILNHPRYRGATILLAGRNFGSGSSREHAAWALLEYGFRIIVAPSFADIFRQNCHQNGIATVVLSESEIQLLMKRAQSHDAYHLAVDIERSRISDLHGFAASFAMDDFRRHCLLHGLDDIGLTLRHESHIAEFERKRAQRL